MFRFVKDSLQKKTSRIAIASMILVSGASALSSAALSQTDSKPAQSDVAEKSGQKDADKTIPDFEPKALADFRDKMPFKSIDFPGMAKAGEASFMEDSDYVLGFSQDGVSRAYPLKMAWFHHVINDKITDASGKDSFFAITYCSVCNTGVRYDSNLEGKPILLDFYGLYYGVVALCDRDTETVWLQASGTAAKGVRAGAVLKSKPLLNLTWARWKALHPDTLVMSPETPFKNTTAPINAVTPNSPHFSTPPSRESTTDCRSQIWC